MAMDHQRRRAASLLALAVLTALAAGAAAGPTPPPPPPSPAAGTSVPTPPANTPIPPVKLVQLSDGYQVTVSGTPFAVKGLVVSSPANFSAAVALGANTVRTYTTLPWDGPGGLYAFMDAAAAAGLKVMVGIQLPALSAAGCGVTTSPTCWYNYASWNTNLAMVAAQVTALKMYPNILFWMIGNEISLGVGPSTPGWQQMWQFVGAAAAVVNAIDGGNHPIGTATPDISQDVVYALNTYVPMAYSTYPTQALDLLGSNVYGNAGLLYPAALRACAQSPPGQGCTLATNNSAYAWTKPYVMSELGPNNWFQASQTLWGDWVEPYSTAKRTMMRNMWLAARNSSSAVSTASLGYSGAPPAQGLNGGACVGTFFFSYGWVWQASATWINMLNQYNYTTFGSAGPMLGYAMKGNEVLDVADGVQQIYTGALPGQQAPAIAAPGLTIDGQTYDTSVWLDSGAPHTASVTATSPSGSTLYYTWGILPVPSGGPTDHNTYAPVAFGAGTTPPSPTSNTLTFVTPATPGAYRLNVWVSTAYGRFAHATCPFYVASAGTTVTVKTNADTFTTDGKLLASGVFGGPGGVVTTNYANSTAPYAYTQVSYAAVSSQPSAQPAGVGGNNFAYFGFTVPAGTVPSSFGTASRVLLGVYLQGGSPVTSMSAVQVYAVPYTWTEAGLTYATSPCNVPADASPAIGKGAGTVMPGLCSRMVAQLTTTSKSFRGNPVLGPSYVPDDGYTPPGLQLDGNYMRFDVTSYVAPLIATGETAFAFMIVGAGPFPAPPPLSFQTKEASPWPVSGENAAYLQLWPAGASSQLTAELQTPVSGSSGRRRSLLQVNGGVLTATQKAALQAAVAAGFPGMQPLQVAVTTSGYNVAITLVFTAANSLSSTQVQALHVATVADLAGAVAASDVLAGAPLAGKPSGYELPLVVSGFNSISFPADAGLAAATAASTQLAAAVTSSTSNITAAATAAGLGAVTLGLPPTVLLQIAVTVSNGSAAGRRSLLQVPPPPGAGASQAALNSYVATGQLDNALQQQPGAAGLHVYTGGRSGVFTFLFALKALVAGEIAAVESVITKSTNLKLLALIALAAVPIVAACLCGMHWMRARMHQEAAAIVFARAETMGVASFGRQGTLAPGATFGRQGTLAPMFSSVGVPADGQPGAAPMIPPGFALIQVSPTGLGEMKQYHSTRGVAPSITRKYGSSAGAIAYTPGGPPQ